MTVRSLGTSQKRTSSQNCTIVGKSVGFGRGCVARQSGRRAFEPFVQIPGWWEMRATAAVNGVRLHYVVEGEGPLVVLLHGWPQTWYCWRRVIAPLAAAGHTVLAPDLRGYGLSDKPPSGYDKRTMAGDVRALAGHLGHERIALLAGHDRGARVAHRSPSTTPARSSAWPCSTSSPPGRCSPGPTRPSPAATGTGCSTSSPTCRSCWWATTSRPTCAGSSSAGRSTARRSRRPCPNTSAPSPPPGRCGPGSTTTAPPSPTTWTPTRPAPPPASASRCRVLALWGDAGLPSRLPVLDIWRRYADDVRGQPIPDCGHFLPEEQPDQVTQLLLAFLQN